MLKRLHLKDFTVFANADFEFVQGLNVIVGANGTGKSHLLKIGYAVETIAETSKKIPWNDSHDNKLNWILGVQATLSDVFLADKLQNLIRRDSAANQSNIQATFGNGSKEELLDFSILYSSDTYASCSIEHAPDSVAGEIATPIFLPPKEVLSFFPGFNSVLKKFKLNFDRTFSDLFSALDLPELREPPTIVRQKIEPIMQGRIRLVNGNFYLYPEKGERFEINLIAEGIRKVGMLAQLLNNGSLTTQTTLFWDEPEANLNPALLRKVAAILAELAHQGFQIILATHSMSLLKEFHILSRQKTDKPLPIRYFGLNADSGQPTTIVTRDDFKFLPDVVALEVELEQADDLEEIFAREDRQFHADSN